MQNAWETKKGFTIIELLVSIVVIGILVTIMIVSYSGIQQRSRDSRRDSDVTQLKIAIEKYHAEESQYPDACGDETECPVSALAAELAPYLATIPHDPRSTADSAADYRYIRGSTASVDYDSYAIKITYEVKPTCKTGQNINLAWWSATVPAC